MFIQVIFSENAATFLTNKFLSCITIQYFFLYPRSELKFDQSICAFSLNSLHFRSHLMAQKIMKRDSLNFEVVVAHLIKQFLFRKEGIEKNNNTSAAVTVAYFVV